VKRIRIGIVGAGFGATAHLPALQNHPRFEVVAIASPSSAARIAQEAKVPHAFTSCAAMLEGCELDAVTVASPPFTHRDDVLATLASGKHVLCEKPFALNVAQAREMCEAADLAGAVCGVSHEFRFVPQLAALEELARNGHLGALRDIEATVLRSNLRASEHRPRSWWFDRERGGGIAGAMLSHLIDMANWLAAASVQSAVGTSRTANPQRQDDRGPFTSTVADGAAALINYGDGAFARTCVDATAAVESATIAVHGEKRTGVASGNSIAELTLFTIDRDLTDELTCKASPYAAYERINGNVPLLMELYDEFAKAIDGKPARLPTFEEALVTQTVLEAAGYGAS
jgi:predicted dehydrogenase